jgi:hypothetical protein
MLKKMMEEKRKLVPKSGYNLVGVDDFEMPGERLYLIGHYTTEEAANDALAAFQKRNPNEQAYIYTPETA